VLDRLHGMEGEDPVRDTEYLASLSAAVRAGIGYGIEVLAVGEERAGAVPLPLLLQARCAARHRIPLELAVRRYVAAERQLAHLAHEESAGLDPDQVRAALSGLTAAAERLLTTATEEYEREAKSRPPTHEARLVKRARRLLAGELVDPTCLDYDLGGHHLGLVARSAEGRPLLRRLATDLDCRALLLAASPEELWAWLGRGGGPIDAAAVREWLAGNAGPEHRIGVGEPKSQRSGWRLTHEQAQAAVGIAQGRGAPVAEYADVALLSSVSRDALATTSLYERCLLPLTVERDGGAHLRDTLRAYFRTGLNASAAGPSLGVSRQTVANRVRQAEEHIGQPLAQCGPALEIALELEELGCFTDLSDFRP